MKDKLKWYHLACREMTCTFVGHDIVSSWRKKKTFDELVQLPYEELPYHMHMSGNPYYEYSSWWSQRCRRCRKRVRAPEWLSESFIVQFKHFIKFGLQTPMWVVKHIFMEYRGWKRFALLPILFTAELGKEFFVYMDSLWDWPIGVFFDITHWVYTQIDDD